MNHLLLLQLLLYMDFGGYSAWQYRTQHCFAINTTSVLRACNRVCNWSGVCRSEVEDIKQYFGATPFTWLIKVGDTQTAEVLSASGLHLVANFPAMKADLLTMMPAVCNQGIEIKVATQRESIQTWVATVAQIYQYNPEELATVIDYLMARGGNAVTFYLAFYNNCPYMLCLVLRRTRFIIFMRPNFCGIS